MAAAGLLILAAAVMPGGSSGRASALPAASGGIAATGAAGATPAPRVALAVENVEGLILVPARLHGPSGVDTSGVLVLDTGAGFLGLDLPVALRLGVTESAEPVRGVEMAEARVSRLELGAMQIDQVGPVLVLDASIIRNAAGRSVLGLAGVGVFEGRALVIDYDRARLVIVPSPPAPRDSLSRDHAGPGTGDSAAVTRSRRVLTGLISARARPVRFRIAGDEKLIVRARFADAPPAPAGPWLDFVFDTGATKSVLFEPAFSESVPAARGWRSLRGLIAPTLIGASQARLTLAPIAELETADARGPLRRADVDCAAIETRLAATISNAVKSQVSGLLGYSFFKGCRIGIDCTNRVLWIDSPARPRNDHPYEYSQIGIQLERDGERVRVLGVAEGSPAEQAGIQVGDELRSVGGRTASPTDIPRLAARLEGAPGTRVRVVLRRDGVDRSYELVRRRLL